MIRSFVHSGKEGGQPQLLKGRELSKKLWPEGWREEIIFRAQTGLCRTLPQQPSRGTTVRLQVIFGNSGSALTPISLRLKVQDRA